MVAKNNQSKNCYSEKINYVFCYKQCLGVFSQAHNYRNMAITNSVPNQKKKIKTGAVQTRTSTKIRNTIRSSARTLLS